MNRFLVALLKRVVTRGALTVVDASGERWHFGDGSGEPQRIRFHDTAVERDILLHPELRLGETYMEGRWSVEEGELAALLELLMQNIQQRHPSRFRLVLRKFLRRFAQNNTAMAARRNAAHHYDIGNDIYALFLDEDWQYSCAYFPEARMTLEDAQRAKKRHIAAKMLLEPGQRVLDIGCGWGGMGLYLAENAGVDVTGITLAREQAARANSRAAGRPNLRFRLEDYRHTREEFNRIVSVGMFEHVGVGYFDEFFSTCRKLLTDDGVMVLHSIGRTGVPGSTNPFMARHIFPGGYAPSLSEVLPAAERSGLIVTDIEIWRLHYAETLRHWRERFMANRDRAAALKDERFVRMWEFYLAGCEASFRAGDLMVFQIQLARSLDAVPLTRDYMGAAERALTARDGGRPNGPALVARSG